MKRRKRKNVGETGWCFALINGRLGEIYFKIGGGTAGISGHCYVTREEFKTKREQKILDADIKKYKLTYRNKKYRNKNRP